MYPEGRDRGRGDAESVVYDPARTHTISASTHHMDVDYRLRGPDRPGRQRHRPEPRHRRPDGTFTGSKGHGRFIKRTPATFARAN
jgi:dihydropyrimidinase